MRRQATSRQQPASNVASQAQNISTNTNIVTEAGSSVNRGVDSVEIQQSPELTYRDIGDESTYVNNDEDLDLGQGPEPDVMTSTSPPASSRISRVSHNPNPRFFDSPRDEHTQQSVPIARRFLDKQSTARVVSPISQYDTQSPGNQFTVLGKRNRNADAPDNDSSDGSDIEFEQNNQDVDPKRRVEKPQQKLPAAKRQRPEDNAGSVAERLPSSINQSFHHSQPSSAQGPQRVQRAESDDITDDETTVEQYEPSTRTQSRWATSNSQAALVNRRVPRTNHRWTDEEDERLIYLLGIYGTSYAAIKKQDNACPPSEGGPMLEHRSQVNCKDRARNLKRKYLR